MADDERERTPADDVLEPFVLEWAERARRAQAAVDALLADTSRVPRIERTEKRDGSTRYVLVRFDRGDGQRGHAVTVKFTEQEWALVCSVVLATHGLKAIDTPEEA